MKHEKLKPRVFLFGVPFYILLFTLFIMPGAAGAASLFIEPSRDSAAAGGLIRLTVMLNTEGESINAVEGRLQYPSNLFSLAASVRSDSVIPLFVEPPEEVRSGEIAFSGIIPGGISGERLTLFSLVFEARRSGAAAVALADARAFLNDGLGSAVSVSAVSAHVTVISRSGGESDSSRALRAALASQSDREPPEPFTPLVGRDRSLLGGKFMLFFDVRDAQSGVDYYEVQELRREAPSADGWRRAESPYLLRDQELQSFISVKAVDRAGNARVAVVPPAHPQVWYKTVFALGIIVFVVLFILHAHCRRKI